MYRIGIKILEARVGVETNRKELLPSFPQKIEVKSLLTDYRDVEEIPYAPGLNGTISIYEDESSEAAYQFSPDRAVFRGPFLEASKQASDLRYSFWGNQGFLFRYVLFILERKHSIFNFHGCALYQEEADRLYLIVGGAGSGKTVYLLSGIERGLKLFSTEIVHGRVVEEDMEWHLGSLVDNVRLGTLKYHFPRFLPVKEIQDRKDIWQQKIALDLSAHSTGKETLRNPELVIIFPRIEEGREGVLSSPIEDKRITAKYLFDNASQKIAETVVLYDILPVVGIDDEETASRRFLFVNQLVEHPSLRRAVTVLSSPHECWGDLLNV